MDTKKLRQKILDLAIHGKLVPQDPNDEPASVLLERIRAEKEQLIKEGKIKAPKKSKSAGDTSHYQKDVPFEVPEGWAWCKIEEIAESNIGLTYKPEDVCSDGIPVLRSNNIKNRRICTDGLIRVKTHILPKQFIGKGDLLICARNGSRNLVGKCALIEQDEEPMSFGAFMAVCRSAFNRWIFLILNSSYFNQYLDNSNSTAINQVTQSMLLSFNIPLPPKNEQARINSMVERLCSCVDELEKHEQVVLAKINDSRKRILELAIHGKLVPQDPTEEPAIELLKRINPAFEPSHNLHYYSLPVGWCECRLQDCVNILNGFAFKSSEYTDSGIRVMRITNVQNGYISDDEPKFYPSTRASEIDRYLLKEGDLLMSLTGNVGRVAFLEKNMLPAALNQRVACIRSSLPSEVLSFVYLVCQTKEFADACASSGKGVAQLNISTEWLKEYRLILPPLNETRRILKAVNQYLLLLDEIANI